MDQMSVWVKQQARAVGFDLVGIAPARSFREHLALKHWVAQGKHGEMTYLERSLEKRLDPLKVMPNARSVILCAVNYHVDRPRSVDCKDDNRGWIARYAWGDDYHLVIEKRLKHFAKLLKESIPDMQYRFYADTGPVMERVFARHAGIGWIGKNTCVINRKIGSWIFLAALLTDLELEPDAPETDHCGTCTRCIDACPTQAITEPYHLDARRCISYLTIEHRGEIDPELKSKMGNHIFGCDICQDVCPWNRKAPTTDDPALQPRDGFFNPDLREFKQRVENEYPKGFEHSPLKRAKQAGLLRNIAIAMENKKG